ncbi:MAG: dephospho-CoA kinase [Chitinispirillia bacterium]|nr:dephospho-CoA kinase [Chitinispirillia bacterium]
MRIGIAGYMGAGKSTCARTFSGFDTIVIDADTEAKLLMQSDLKVQFHLKEAFGESVVDNDTICFRELGLKAFFSVDTLLTLNKIVHPPLVKHLEPIIFNNENTNCILDAALIPLLNIESWFDLCIWVDLPFEIRSKRLKAKRSDIEETELHRRMRLQEEMMPVPQNKHWVKLPDSECGQYIRNRLEMKTPDVKGEG